MSILSGDMDPKSPEWLNRAKESLEGISGYKWAASEGSGAEYARLTSEIGLEYLGLQMNDSDAALKTIPEYLKRFSDINRNTGILNSLTPEQFGLIINIAALQYKPEEDESRGHYLYGQVEGYLSDKRSDKVGGFTSQIRNPRLVRDLVVHLEAINWPHDGSYARFLSNAGDWETAERAINAKHNNPIMFAITVPLSTTPADIQERYRNIYPETTQDGIDIIAARLFNRGAHHEHLLRGHPEWAGRYTNWETTITDALEWYSESYRDDIIRAITQPKWHVYNDVAFNFPGLTEILLQTSFSLGQNGELVRKTLQI